MGCFNSGYNFVTNFNCLTQLICKYFNKFHVFIIICVLYFGYLQNVHRVLGMRSNFSGKFAIMYVYKITWPPPLLSILYRYSQFTCILFKIHIGLWLIAKIGIQVHTDRPALFNFLLFVLMRLMQHALKRGGNCIGLVCRYVYSNVDFISQSKAMWLSAIAILIWILLANYWIKINFKLLYAEMLSCTLIFLKLPCTPPPPPSYTR